MPGVFRHGLGRSVTEAKIDRLDVGPGSRMRKQALAGAIGMDMVNKGQPRSSQLACLCPSVLDCLAYSCIVRLK